MFPHTGADQAMAGWLDQPLCDASEQASAQDWIPLEINQLGAGRYAGRYREVALDGFGLVVESQNCAVHKRGVMHDDFCTLSYVRTPGANLRFSEHLAQEQSLFFLSSASEFDIQVEGGDETHYFRLPYAAFEADLVTLAPGFDGHQVRGVQCFSVDDKRPLHALVDTLLAQPERLRSDAVSEVLYAQLLQLTASAQTATPDSLSGLTARVRASRVVARATDYAEAAFAAQRVPSIVELCQESAVSQRTLQYSFQALLGLTPVAYLRILRLNRVRAQLLAPERSELTVTEVATYWHFLHLGKFARDYAAMFGEPPSQTLRRALA